MSQFRKFGPGVLLGVMVLIVVASLGLLSCGGGGTGGEVKCVDASCIGTASSPAGTSAGASLPLATTCTASAGAITLNAGAARASGVAPLAVFFDATATKSASTSRPFHDIEYRWDFGDPSSGTWNAGAGQALVAATRQQVQWRRMFLNGPAARQPQCLTLSKLPRWMAAARTLRVVSPLRFRTQTSYLPAPIQSASQQPERSI